MSRRNRQKRWWQTKEEALRKDMVEALKGLRDYVDNINTTPSLILSVDSTFQEKVDRNIYSTKVQEWVLGYRVLPINRQHGFFLREVYAKVVDGRLDEINERERKQVVDALTSVIDPWQEADVAFVSDSCLCVRQRFAVMFHHEGNPNIVTPSAELINASLDPAKQKKGDE
jgi:hypothetical protein